MNIKSKTFNMAASMSAFLVGSAYVLSDGASITANVIGSSGGSSGLTSIMGIVIIVGSIGLFIASMHHHDNPAFERERHVRESNHHEHINGDSEAEEEN
ncbi:MAG TPA: hypothetical protein VEC16_04635 [Alphaproteobacteria bacterium]|nr:hypothetical protein [Alphaproteobacteria bacterium]